MVTLEEWKRSKEFQQEYETFRKTNCGEALIQSLISMMLDGWPQLSKEADVVEVEAMSSSFLKGYRQCLRNLDNLRGSVLENDKSSTPQEFTPTGLPLDPVIKARVIANLPR